MDRVPLARKEKPTFFFCINLTRMRSHDPLPGHTILFRSRYERGLSSSEERTLDKGCEGWERPVTFFMYKF